MAVWANYLSESERSYRGRSENGTFKRLWKYCLRDIERRNIRKTVETAKIPKFSRVNLLLLVAQNQ